MTNSEITQNHQETALEKSLPQLLKEKREELGLEISQLAKELNIRAKDLETIENEDLAALPNNLYIGGILRSYAKSLQIDHDLVEKKMKLIPIKSNASNKKYSLLNIGENLDLKPDREQFFNFLIIFALLFVVIWTLCSFYERNSGLIDIENLIREMSQYNLK